MSDNEAIKEGSLSPNFQLNTLHHDRFFLNQEKGKIVVLIFWATWCEQCKIALVELNQLIAQYKTSKVLFAGVCSDPENMDDVKRIVQQLNISYPIILDNNAKIYKKYRLRGFPTIIIIDQNRAVSLIEYGYNQTILHHIKRKIEHLLGIMR
ncbi:MAG: TlpA family protein disulfide reductase [Desulfobacterales bacterium]|nr:TlpA family protein disulfide reductase [Desulfobacterales bacterium]